MSRFKCIFIIFCSITISCQNSDEPPTTVYNVPEEFQQYVDRFISEGQSRGVTIKIDNLIMRYSNELDNGVCGNCNSNSLTSDIQKVVSINSSVCWANDVQLEALIFHELGHCILGRGHKTDLLPNGDPKSMMITNDISIYSPCVYDIGGGNCNQLFKRTYYLDELFDENTPVPDWGK